MSVTVANDKQPEVALSHVTHTTGPVILGLPTCHALGLVTLKYTLHTEHCSAKPVKSKPTSDLSAKKKVLEEYSDVFSGIGCFKGSYHIRVDPKVPPVVHPPRRVPVALQQPLKEELDSLVAKGIISPVTQPIDLVNSMVCVFKPNGKIRLCLDPKDLNPAIK